MMKIALLLSLLSSAFATDFGSRSVVLTSADIKDNTPYQISILKSNAVYRIYATYALAGSDDYAKNVFITDNTGARFTVYGLSLPNADAGVYFLDNLRTLRAPITVQDTNAGAHSTPYTIYVVDANVVSFPVVSARAANGIVDSYNGFVAAGVTVLSAEPMFTMSQFDMYGLSNMVISSVGFDQTDSKYNVLAVSSWEAPQSFLTMYGPICTIFNTNWGWNARFKFSLARTSYPTNYNLNYGAAFALMSPGYLASDASYNIPYTIPEALAASYNWNGNNHIGVKYTAADFQTGESVRLDVKTADGQQANTLNLVQTSNNDLWQWASGVSMTVQNPNNAGHVPRFLFRVTSGASLSFSLAAVLIVSLFSKLY